MKIPFYPLFFTNANRSKRRRQIKGKKIVVLGKANDYSVGEKLILKYNFKNTSVVDTAVVINNRFYPQGWNNLSYFIHYI